MPPPIPRRFLRLTARRGARPAALASYALDPSTGTAYSYSLSTAVGTFFTSGSAVPTLGTIDSNPGSVTYGQFSPVYVLSVNAGGTPLGGTIVGVAADNFPGGTGDFYVGTSDGHVYRYSATDGDLVGAPLTLTDASGHRIDISGLFFDTADDQLDAIDSTFNRRVSINLTNGVVTPQSASGSVPDTIVAPAFDPATNMIVAFNDATSQLVSLGTVPIPTQPGIFARNIGTLRVNGTGDYSGQVVASGNIGPITIGGPFSGGITAGGNMGIVTIHANLSGALTGALSGALDAAGNLAGVTITPVVGSNTIASSVLMNANNIASSALINAGGTLTQFTLPRAYSIQTTMVNNKPVITKIYNQFAGVIEAQWAPSINIGADVVSTSNTPSINVAYSASATFGGDFGGTFATGTDVGGLAIGGNVGSFSIAGNLLTGASVNITGNAGSVAVGQSVETGSQVNVAGSTTSFKVGGTLAGQMSSGMGLGTGSFGAVNAGLLDDAGLNTGSVTVAGSMTNGILSFGTQIGSDDIYDSSDDVITGGSVQSVNIGGNYTNSVIAAGVLPSLALGPFRSRRERHARILGQPKLLEHHPGGLGRGRRRAAQRHRDRNHPWPGLQHQRSTVVGRGRHVDRQGQRIRRRVESGSSASTLIRWEPPTVISAQLLQFHDDPGRIQQADRYRLDQRGHRLQSGRQRQRLNHFAGLLWQPDPRSHAFLLYLHDFDRRGGGRTGYFRPQRLPAQLHAHHSGPAQRQDHLRPHRPAFFAEPPGQRQHQSAGQ